jgi:hypothetical protein
VSNIQRLVDQWAERQSDVAAVRDGQTGRELVRGRAALRKPDAECLNGNVYTAHREPRARCRAAFVTRIGSLLPGSPRTRSEGSPVSIDREIAARPLSFAQERLWFLDQLQPGSPAYTIFDAVRLRGALDTSALRRSLSELVRRHEVLRSTFPSVSGRPVQVAQPAVALEIPVTDLRHLSPERRRAELDRLLGHEAARPLSLMSVPLLRATIVRMGDEDHVLSLAVHHIAYDAWSDRVLYAELAALYAAFHRDEPSPLARPDLQYADFAVWQREQLSGATLARELTHWRQALEGAPHLLALPLDRPRPSVQRLQGRSLAFALDPELTATVNELARHQGVTLFMTLLAAFEALLYRYSGQSSLLVGTPVANRGRVELEAVIGFFSNTLAIRADITPETTGAELLQQVRDRSLVALDHQDLPFERLVEELAPAREASHQPVIQAVFALRNASPEGLRLPGLDASPLRVRRDTAIFDLLLDVEQRSDGLHPLFQYNSDLFDEATVARMAEHYRELLAALAADPTRPVVGLELLTDRSSRSLHANARS